MIFLRPFSKEKYPLLTLRSDSRLLIWQFEVLFDTDSKKVVRELEKSYEITKFSISTDLKTRFSSNIDRFSHLVPQMSA
jgi:hypothetical protein